MHANGMEQMASQSTQAKALLSHQELLSPNIESHSRPVPYIHTTPAFSNSHACQFRGGKGRLKLTLTIQDKLRSTKIVTKPELDRACFAVGELKKGKIYLCG
jgi:hypothetical protein